MVTASFGGPPILATTLAEGGVDNAAQASGKPVTISPAMGHATGGVGRRRRGPDGSGRGNGPRRDGERHSSSARGGAGRPWLGRAPDRRGGSGPRADDGVIPGPKTKRGPLMGPPRQLQPAC